MNSLLFSGVSVLDAVQAAFDCFPSWKVELLVFTLEPF